jgi:hypothetical protein
MYQNSFCGNPSCQNSNAKSLWEIRFTKIRRRKIIALKLVYKNQIDKHISIILFLFEMQMCDTMFCNRVFFLESAQFGFILNKNGIIETACGNSDEVLGVSKVGKKYDF